MAFPKHSNEEHCLLIKKAIYLGILHWVICTIFSILNVACLIVIKMLRGS